jgi:AsmA-like C-terminal region/Protein of unknown function
MTNQLPDVPEPLPVTPHEEAVPAQVRLGPTGRVKKSNRHWTLHLSIRGVKIFAEIVAVLILLFGLGAGYILWQFSKGPINDEDLTRQVAMALESRLPKGFAVTLSSMEINEVVGQIQLSVAGLVIKDASAKPVLVAPKANIAFDALSLLIGRIVPKTIDLSGLLVAVTIGPDGRVDISEDVTDGELPQQEVAPQPSAPPSDQAQAGILAIGNFVDALSTKEGPLGLLDHATLRNGILRIDDQRHGRQMRYRDLAVTLDRSDDAHQKISVSAQGDHGNWSATSYLTGRIGEPRQLVIEGKDIAVSELLGFAEEKTVPVQTDMPLSLEVTLSVDSQSKLTNLTGKITGGRATLILDDPKAPPIKVEEVSGDFTLSDDGARIIIPSIQFANSGNHWQLTGDVTIPHEANESWMFNLSSRGAIIASDQPGYAPNIVDNIAISGGVTPGFKALRLTSVEAKGSNFAISGHALLGAADGRDGLALDLKTQGSDALPLLALWPSFLVPEVRAYLGESILRGTVKNGLYRLDLDPDGLRAVLNKAPIPESAVALDLDFENGTLRPDKGLPPISQLSGKVHVTGTQVSVDVLGGIIDVDDHRHLKLQNATYRVFDTSLMPTHADVVFSFSGPASDFAQVMRSDMMRSVSAPPLDPSKTEGDIAMTVTLAFPQKPDLKPTDIKISATGDFTNLAIANLVGDQNLENATADIVAGDQGLIVIGDGKIGGAPSHFEMRQPPASQTRDATLAMTLDDALREKKNIRTPGQLSGPVTLSLSLKGIGGDKVHGKGDLDFSKASINGVIPGWIKPANKPLKAVFLLTPHQDQSISISDFSIDDPSIALKGKAELGSDGALRAMTLSSLRVAAGDKVTASVERAGAGYKVSIQGETLDGRALIKSAFSSKSQQSQDLDVDLKLGTLTGFNGEVMKAVDLRAQTRNGALKDLKLDARLGTQQVTGQPARSESGQNVIVIQTADAGALLRYMDFYKRMNSGAMTFQLATSGDPLDGEIAVRRFAILEESAIADLNTKAGAQTGRAIVTDPKNVQFNRLNASFSIGGGKIAIKDGVVSGPVIGGTVEGVIDYGKGGIDVKGAIVPAYLVNNLFNKLPLIGNLLGGENEGVFSINYRATGALTSPEVSYNPLSAVAPGFLRKLFEAGAPSEETPPAKMPPKDVTPQP